MLASPGRLLREAAFCYISLKALPAVLGVPTPHIGGDPAAHEPLGIDLQIPGIQQRDEVVQDPVGHLLVEGALVAEGPEVQLQGLQLHTRLVGNIADLEMREVRLPGQRAQACEFRAVEYDLIVPLGLGIFERLQILARPARHGFSSG